MKNTFPRIIITLSAIIATLNISVQTYPTRKLQKQMQTEERTFLSNMKPGLQHTQMLAVRAAIQGDDSALQQIRQSRNIAPTLPETSPPPTSPPISAFLFLSMLPLASVHYCFTFMEADGASAA